MAKRQDEMRAHGSASVPDMTESDCEAVLRANPRDTHALHRLAILKTHGGDLGAATGYFRRVLDGDPSNVDALNTLGRLMLAQGDSAGARACCERALQIDPEDASAHKFLADMCLAAGDHENAVANYRRAVAADQSLSAVHSRIGAVLYALDRPGEAREPLEKALALNNRDADAHNNLGNVLLSEDDPTLAINHYEKASQINPNWAPPHRNRGRALTELGRIVEAISEFREALRLAPDDQDSVLGLADALAADGQTEEAISVLEAANREAPGELKILFALGVNYTVLARWQDAAVVFEEASSSAIASPDVLNNLARPYLELGRIDDAIEAAQAAIALKPDYALAYNTLASCYIGKTMPDEALQACDRALQLDPKLFAAAYNRGLTLRRLGRMEEARCQFEAANKLSPDSPELHGGLAALYREIGEFDKAEEHYRQAFALAPHRVEYLYHLASLLQHQKRSEDLIAEGGRLVADKPEYVPGYVLLAMGLMQQERFAESEEALLTALDIEPRNYECLIALANQYHSAWRLDEAVAVFEKTLEYHPDDSEALAQLVDINMSQCSWTNYEKFSRDLLDRVRRDLANDDPVSVDVFSLQALPVDYAFIAKAARNKAKAYADDQDWARPSARFTFNIRGRKKIRIGYVLAYTWFHSLPMVLKNVIEQHDRDRFEVYGYSLRRGDGSEFDLSYRRAFDEFRDLEEDFPDSAARSIYRDDLDILIDVAGQTAINCMPMLSFRPAPIQAHYLGYSITTGADYVDYLITDDIYIPESLEAHCSESLVRLPGTFMATTRAGMSVEATTRAAQQLPDDAFVLCNFNHPCKFEPEIFGVWMRILERIPNSVLWLGDWAGATRKNVLREAQDRGIPGDRLIFAEIVDHTSHSSRLRLADLAVDPHHHGGGITTVDALWSGVPVVTMCGETPSSRLGATLLNAAQLPETITHSLAEYEELVVALANDPRRLKVLRDRLWEDRLSSPLFDSELYVRNLERGYEAMARLYRDGEAPQDIRVT